MKKLLANLSLRVKFLIIGAIAALMLALPSVPLLRSDLQRLDTARTQFEGLAPARAVVEWIHATQQHRGLSSVVLGGDTSAAQQRRDAQATAHTLGSQTAARVADLRHEVLSRTTAQLVQDWNTLAAAVGAGTLDARQSLQQHSALIARQLALLRDVTHVARLVLVADARTYYLQAAVLGQLPRLTEAFAQARGQGVTLLAQGRATPEERVRITQLGLGVAAIFADARQYLELAVEGDAAARTTIGPAIDAATAAARQGMQAIDEHIAQAQTLSLPPAQFYQVVTQAIEAQFKLVQAAQDVLADNLTRELRQARNQIIRVALACAALALLGVWVMWVVSRNTTASIGSALRMAQAVADGDLTLTISAQGRDEAALLLRALERMRQSLATTVGSVRGNAAAVAAASTQIAQGNHDLSQRTEEQASALEQTAASMEELGTAVSHNADHARQANELARGASAVAAQGGDVVAQVVGTMKGIHDSSRRIADIIGVIDGIAFQTNILALNAAVEAARAGEQGRGFAVVASEVRGLAQRSAEAAKEISSLITASVAQVEQGSALVDQAGTTMQQVVAAIRRVTDIMGEISSASSEQSAGVAQVVTAVNQMDQTTQQNAALVEESATAAESLRAQAQQLVDAVAVFRLDAEGAACPG